MLAVETLAVLPGWRTDEAQEGAAHGFEAAEAAAFADRLERVRGLLEQPARGLHAHRGDEPGRRRTQLAREHAREVARAHRHPARERADVVRLAGTLEDVGLQLAQGLVLRELHGELRAELRLAAR